MINLNVISKLKPCKDRLDNYVKHYGNREFTNRQFMGLKNITHHDKLWVALLLMDENNLRLAAADIAESVLHIYEAYYPKDLSPRKAIEAARLYVAGKITKEELRAESLASSKVVSTRDVASAYGASSDCKASSFSILSAYHASYYDPIFRRSFDAATNVAYVSSASFAAAAGYAYYSAATAATYCFAAIATFAAAVYISATARRFAASEACIRARFASEYSAGAAYYAGRPSDSHTEAYYGNNPTTPARTAQEKLIRTIILRYWK